MAPAAYTLKELPEDFLVEEIFSPKLSGQGRYAYFLLKKRDLTTRMAIGKAASAFDVPAGRINYAGTKDRRAATVQHISVNGLSPGRRRDLDLGDCSLHYLGQSDERLNLGAHEGNRFTIVARDIVGEFPIDLSSNPNYFGTQRFSKKNADIGRSVLQGDFREAIALVRETDPQAIEERFVGQHAYVEALRALPAKMLRMYVHAYQSLLWNRAVSGMVRTLAQKSIEVPQPYGIALAYPLEPLFLDAALPLVAHDLDEEAEEAMGKLDGKEREAYAAAVASMGKALADDGLSPRSLLLRQFPSLTPEAKMRPLFIPLDLSAAWADDDLHQGKMKVTLSFTLPASAYATVAAEALFAPLLR